MKSWSKSIKHSIYLDVTSQNTPKKNKISRENNNMRKAGIKVFTSEKFIKASLIICILLIVVSLIIHYLTPSKSEPFYNNNAPKEGGTTRIVNNKNNSTITINTSYTQEFEAPVNEFIPIKNIMDKSLNSYIIEFDKYKALNERKSIPLRVVGCVTPSTCASETRCTVSKSTDPSGNTIQFCNSRGAGIDASSGKIMYDVKDEALTLDSSQLHFQFNNQQYPINGFVAERVAVKEGFESVPLVFRTEADNQLAFTTGRKAVEKTELDQPYNINRTISQNEQLARIELDTVKPEDKNKYKLQFCTAPPNCIETSCYTCTDINWYSNEKGFRTNVQLDVPQISADMMRKGLDVSRKDPSLYNRTFIRIVPK